MHADEIYRRVKAQIDGGKLAVGGTCPSEHELAAEYDASRGTVRRALERLAEEGYLVVVQGRRRKVRLPAPRRIAPLRLPPPAPLPLTKFRGRTAASSQSFGQYLIGMGKAEGWEPSDDVLVSPQAVACSGLSEEPRLDAVEVAEKLLIKRRRDKVIWLLRRRVGRGMTLALQWVVVPVRLVREIGYDDLHPGGLTRLYRERYGIHRAAAEAHYRPARASRDEARMLGLPRDAPLIEERRTSLCLPPHRAAESADGLIPYEYLLSLYTDHVSLDFSWSDSAGNNGTISN